jgi:hypothetical protein
MEIEDYLDYTDGDYFEYELNIDDMIQSEEDDDDSIIGYKDVETSFRISIKGTETVTFSEDSIECWIIQTNIEMKYTLEGDGEYTDYMILDAEGVEKSWIDKKTHVSMKGESEFQIRGESHYPEGDFIERVIFESESIEKKDYSVVEAGPPFPLKVGKTWSNQNTYTTNTTTKDRYKFDDEEFSDWSFEYDVEEISETINYEIISENENVVPAGTFTTLKIKEQVKGESDYRFIFQDKYGMDIEVQEYEEGALAEIFSLKSYQFDQAKDTDNDGYRDIIDDFPDDPNENNDADNDSVGDNTDSFPTDPAASIDSDSDGYPDKWNDGKTEADSTSGLSLDDYPQNADKWEKDSDDSSSLTMFLALIVVIVLVIIMILIILMRKKKPSMQAPPPPQQPPQAPQHQTPPPPPPGQRQSEQEGFTDWFD